MFTTRLRRTAVTASTILFLFVFGTLAAHAATLYAVDSGNNLVRFDSASPGSLTTVGPITGLQAGENIVGIDVRPATGELFALGSASRLYTINRGSGAATFIAALSTALAGTSFAVDFNPTVDRLRIVSDTGQNLRVNPNNGATTVDGVINPGTPQVTAAGYTNSFNGATTTTLFDIDTATDQLFTQNPPNNGTLVVVGPLGVDITSVNGFDIFAGDGIAYLAATPAIGIGQPNLFTVNLATGAATPIGPIGMSLLSPIRGLAADTGSSAVNFNALGVTTANQLVRFNTNRPNTQLGTPTAITGLQAGENVVGIDFRPANGLLYALGSNSRIYTINVGTGAATFVSTLSTPLSGTEFGVDFNPVPDRLRVISNTGQNLRIDVTTGATTVDGVVNPGTPEITAAAYTNSFAGATATTLYTIDTTTDVLNVQTPPNNGTQVLVGPLGINITAINGFDISPVGTTALLAAQVGAATTSQLYSVNLTTGTASFVGPINAAAPLRGFAIAGGSAASTTVDFDGDGRTDYSVFRTSNNVWYIANSSTNSQTFTFTQFGLTGDTFTPGDYDGDSRDDISVFRAGVFYVLRSGSNTISQVQFGVNGDEPVARDYDGDSRTDYAVIRRTGGQMIWYVNNSANNSVRIEQFGLDVDVTAPGDYDGDGRFDLATYRATPGGVGTFYANRSTTGFTARQFGQDGDLFVPGDYDGDGRSDIAVLRPGTQYQWFYLRSSDNSFNQINLGTKPHFATQGDYDGDGRTDVSVYDPGAGAFYTYRSFNGALLFYRFGQNGDIPIASFDTH